VSDLAKIFKAYDIRGVVPDELDEAVAESVGAAFASLTGARAVVTVHDMRTSSGPLAEAFGRGVTSQGADVVRAASAPPTCSTTPAAAWDCPAR
jgi:phosphomannomutase